MSGARRLLVRVLAPLLLTCGLAGCQMGSAKPAAEARIMPLHDMYNAGQFQAMYDSADAAFKATVARDEFTRVGEALRVKLGRVTATLPNGYDVTAGTSGTVVTLKYRTTFERGEGLETFEFRVRGRTASLLAYTVNSPALVVD